MTPRMNIFETAPDAVKAMMTVEAAIEQSGFDHGLAELVRIRASQINGCAFCIYMHIKDAVKHGETDTRIHLLSAWRESPLFSDRERAALAWTEAVTLVSQTNAPDADYDLVKSQFNEKEIAYLTVLISAINFWNRVQVALRAVHQI